MRLDPLDVRIVGLLLQDARLSFREIAERLGSTTPTISARIKALEDIGLLQAYRAQVDPRVLGGAAYVLTLTVQPAQADAALEQVRALPHVSTVHLLPGGRIVAHVHLRPPGYALAHLHQAIASLPGLLTYDAGEVIAEHHQPPIEGIPEDVDVPCHQCKGPIHGDPVKGRFGERAHVFCCRQCLGAFGERFQQHDAAAKGKAPAKAGGPAKQGAGAERHHHP